MLSDEQLIHGGNELMNDLRLPRDRCGPHVIELPFEEPEGISSFTAEVRVTEVLVYRLVG